MGKSTLHVKHRHTQSLHVDGLRLVDEVHTQLLLAQIHLKLGLNVPTSPAPIQR